MNIFVGNLAFAAKDADVYKLFLSFGKVSLVSIVMDKKGRESRGFGFLEMPDELEAKAAIAALNGKEFMGRPLNLEPARPKEAYLQLKPEFQKRTQEGGAGKKSWFDPVFKRTGRYKQGRRTHSFMKKRQAAGATEPLPERKVKENPMRWRKKKPWQKKRGEHKPGDKVEAEPKSWKKAKRLANPHSRAKDKTYEKKNKNKH